MFIPKVPFPVFYWIFPVLIELSRPAPAERHKRPVGRSTGMSSDKLL